MSYPILTEVFINKYYLKPLNLDPKFDPVNGPYYVIDGLFDISSEYTVVCNLAEITEFLFGSNNEQFNTRYFHLDNVNETDQIIRNLVYYGYDLFTWWTVKKSILNSDSVLECNKTKWLNTHKVDDCLTLHYSRYYERLFDDIVIRRTNGEIRTASKLIERYNIEFQALAEDNYKLKCLDCYLSFHDDIDLTELDCIQTLDEILYHFTNCTWDSKLNALVMKTNCCTFG